MAKLEYLSSRITARGQLPLADAERVAEELRDGGLAVLPTETGYMLAALATDEEAILRAFRVKGRDLAHTVHIACSSLAMAQEYGEVTPVARDILGALTPGPVTVVVRQTSRLPTRLVTENGTVGIRVPDNPLTMQIITAVGVPLTATSLNKAGEPPMRIEASVLEPLDWPAGGIVYVVREDDSIRYDKPSTLVRVTGPAPEVLREGPICLAAITRFFPG